MRSSKKTLMLRGPKMVAFNFQLQRNAIVPSPAFFLLRLQVRRGGSCISPISLGLVSEKKNPQRPVGRARKGGKVQSAPSKLGGMDFISILLQIEIDWTC